jgi:hypothetical protein
MEDKIKELLYAGYYEDDGTYTIEIKIKDLKKILCEVFNSQNIKLI